MRAHLDSVVRDFAQLEAAVAAPAPQQELTP
jgi:hypothetical protein